MTVNALDTLVHTVIYTLWAIVVGIFIVGAVLLHRHNAGLHRAAAQAVDTGHRPGHARPARPPLAVRIVAALAAGWRDLAHAQALATGGELWPSA